MKNSRTHIHLPTTLGAKISDSVSARVGSWPFILIQSFLLATWVTLNCVGWFYHWDAPPFILLNLMLSFQAAFTGPFVMMSQNRQGEKDRLRDNLEAVEVDEIHTTDQRLVEMNEQQLKILNQQNEILAILREQQTKRRPAKQEVQP